MEAEGWYHDPYERHEARWFSDGTPTDLVRDGEQVAHDAPPPDPVQSPLVPWDGDTTGQVGDDLRRADSAQEGANHATKREQVVKVARVVLNPGDTEFW
jgi:hypothetical protein